MNLENMSKAELEALIKSAKTALATVELRNRKAALEAAKAAAAEHGFSLDELTTGKKPKPPAKYRDPDTGATWTGRGRYPEWYKAKIAAGVSPEELKV